MVSNNVKYVFSKDKLETYSGFTLSLLDCIIEYHLDYNTLNNVDDIKNHYSWCYNKTCSKNNDFKFTNNDKLKRYFFDYYYNQLYNVKNVDINKFKKYQTLFWKNMFTPNVIENIKIIVEIYKIFEIEQKNP